MALRWIEGFEISSESGYLSRKYATSLSASTNTPGRLHGRYASGIFTTPSLGVASEWVIGFGLYVPSSPTVDANYVALFRGGLEQCRLAVTASRYLTLEVGATTLDTGATQLAAGTWYYVELKVSVKAGATGSYELRINEVLELTGSSVATGDSGSDDADVVKFCIDTNCRIDDIYVLDTTGTDNNDFLGDQVVEGVLPDGDGASTDWTPSTGSSHYALVDDPATAIDTADFVESSTIGHKDYYDFEALSVISGNVNGVAVAVAAGLDAVGVRTMRVRFRNAAATEYGSASATTLSGTTISEQVTVFGTNPISTAAWTVSDIDGGQFGVELVS